MNKDYSDAFGFRLVGYFTSFLAEYPEKGKQIQSICDEDFKATCIKCYPLIISTGIDPAKYSPSTLTASANIRTTLREMFPVKEEVVDLETESEEDEVPEKSPKKMFTKKAPKEPLLKTVNVSCSKCSQLTTINNNLLKELEISIQNEKNLLAENKNLRKALAEKSLDLKKAKEEVFQYFEFLNNKRKRQ